MRTDSALLSLVLFALMWNRPTKVSAQGNDNAYDPKLTRPAYALGKGPILAIDEAHNNNIADGRWNPFKKLLLKDGYRIQAFTNRFTSEALRGVDILVVANALADRFANAKSLPTTSAFEPAEIDAVEKWVKEGGSLFLLAGHMPWPGAAEKLAERFDVLFQNGFGYPQDPDSGRLIMSSLDERKDLIRCLFVSHPIATGRSLQEAVTSLQIGGHSAAFRVRPGGKAQPLLVLEGQWMLLLPEVSWELSEKTPRIRADGMLLAAVANVERGRAVLLGINAVSFTANLRSPNRTPWGINDPKAGNAQFVLNMMHWLSALLPAK